MANENGVFADSISGSKELAEYGGKNDNQPILRLNILKKLLKFFKVPNQKYLLSAVLQFVQEEYEEEVFCRELPALIQEEYIEISLVDAQTEANGSDTAKVDAPAAKQLLEEGNYDKILITLKEQKSGLLLRSFVDVNIAMIEMKLQFNKVEEEVEQYKKTYQNIKNINSEFQQKYNGVKKNLDEWDSKLTDLSIQIDQTKSHLTEQATSEYKIFLDELDKKQKDIEASVESKAKEKAGETIEEEIKSKGRIGQAMQDAQKSIIQYLAIFVAIFALVNINVLNAAKWTYKELFRVNIIMTTSMATLVTLVHIFTDKEHQWIRKMLVLLALLWIVLAFGVLF